MRQHLLLFLLCCSIFGGESGPSVNLPYARIDGIENSGLLVQRFLGVPYAEPNPLRFMESQPINESRYGSNFVIDATKNGPFCPQGGGGSDNCFNLNIARPTSGATGLPVMVWIYGGAFVEGKIDDYDPSVVIYYAQSLSMPVIHVAMNYRVNGFGFLASSQASERGALNLGLKDQRLAIHWVKKYISYFGGDASKIMIYGESAGAIAVSYQLTAYAAKKDTNLFRGAIMESGSGSTVRVPNATYWQPVYDKLVSDSGCSSSPDSFSCLQNLDFNTISDLISNAQAPQPAIAHFPFGPTLDYDFIPDAPYLLLQRGEFVKVPIIAGDNLDEGTSFSAYTNWNSDNDVKNYAIIANFPELSSTAVDNLMNFYPNNRSLGSPYNTGDRTYMTPQFKRASSLIGDLAFVAPRRAVIDKFSSLGVPTWTYRFDFDWSNGGQLDNSNYWGVQHSDEIPAVYGVVDNTMTRAMCGYWIAFANALDPNFQMSAFPRWDSFNSSSLAQIRFETSQTIMRKDEFRRTQTDYINSISDQMYPFEASTTSVTSSSSDSTNSNSNSNSNGGLNSSSNSDSNGTSQRTTTEKSDVSISKGERISANFLALFLAILFFLVK